MSFVLLFIFLGLTGAEPSNGSFLGFNTNVPPQPCSTNEVWTSCSPSTCFEAVCGIPPTDVCTKDCKRGCRCQDGYARYDGVCILNSTCPPGGPSTCSDNEEWTECSSSTCFEQRCDSPPPAQCTMDCKRGCKCIGGFARILDQCVNQTRCPPLSTPSFESPTPCGANEIFTRCSSSSCFEHRCDTPPTLLCTRDCKMGCKCMDGFARMGANCVNETTCPRLLAANSTAHNSGNTSAQILTGNRMQNLTGNLTVTRPSNTSSSSSSSITTRSANLTFAPPSPSLTPLQQFAHWLTGELAELAEMHFNGNRTLYVASRKANCTRGAGMCLLTRYDQRVPYLPLVRQIRGFQFQPGFEFQLFVHSQLTQQLVQYDLIRIISKVARRRRNRFQAGQNAPSYDCGPEPWSADQETYCCGLNPSLPRCVF